MTNRKTSICLIATCFLAVAGAGTANAGGFLADTFIKPFNPGLARAADDAHRRMGRPLDHAANQAAGAGANYVVPGSGPYVTQGLEMRDRYNRNQPVFEDDEDDE